MAEHNELGKLGEEMAVEFLRKDGYTIYKPTTLFRKQKLIFLPKENTLAVVEVKTRSSLEFDCLRILLNQKNPASC
jgi:putative endonuclease